MKQYIDKSAVVAEIERRLSLISQNTNAYEEGRKRTYIAVLYLLDSLETKEIDLDYIKDELDRAVKIYKPNGNFGWGTLYNIATHFYELGLKAQKENKKNKT